MGTATNIVFLIIALILFIITGWFITKAWWDINVIAGNEKLDTAHKYLTWGMVLCWLAVIIVLVILIAGGATGHLSGIQIPESFDEAAKSAQKIAGGEHAVRTGADVAILFALTIVGLLTFATGGFSAGAALLINRSGDFGANKSAYSDAVIAAVTGIGGSKAQQAEGVSRICQCSR